MQRVFVLVSLISDWLQLLGKVRLIVLQVLISDLELSDFEIIISSRLFLQYILEFLGQSLQNLLVL